MDYLLIINIILTNSGVLKLIKLQIASVVCRRSTMSRRQFTLDEKIGIIGRLENGEKNSVISKEFGTCSSTISTIWKNKDKLKNMFQTTSLNAKRLRTAQHKDLEEAALVWFKQQRYAVNIRSSCCIEDTRKILLHKI
ncbi:unnamed protein product [Macrosiphum euphorbiae]|uniref:HTH psq-type domain-containing protein n=2 Tax=Macrosiphum euphorbiae TaxID=13131 RepID=A0AAV0XBR6_9HEMI|nr:unnamed protein product [Macrosiphum euphorbiae]